MTKARAARGFLGLDLGTSAVKALLVDEAGASLAAAERPLRLHRGSALAAEQDAGVWWEAAAEASRACLAEASGTHVAAVGLTGQKHALLPVDAAGTPLARARLWADGRAAAEAAVIARDLPDLAEVSGAPALPGYLLPKWRHLQREAPPIAARTRRLVFAKDWLRFQLTGEWFTDPTEASATQLFDAERGTWSAALADAVGLSLDLLPPVRECAAIAGRTGEGAAAAGLPVGVPVAGGAGDNEAAALGVATLEPGPITMALGTSGTVIAPARERGPVGGLVWGRHVVPGSYAATGTVLSVGRALAWARRTFLPDLPTVAMLVEAAESVDDLHEIPVFLPSLVGERSPVPDPRASGAFAGLRPDHGARHLARAVVEGVAACLGQVVDLMRDAGVPARELRFTSGGAASPFLRRCVAAAARLPGRRARSRTGPALGAAMLAAAAVGHGSLPELASDWVRLGQEERPSETEAGHMAGVREQVAALRATLADQPRPPACP
ncbi:MAG: xylulokinase [Planctomycetota bacterium]|jgi:xylulokinase